MFNNTNIYNMKQIEQKKYLSMFEAVRKLQGIYPLPQSYNSGKKWIIKNKVEMVKVDEDTATRYYVDQESLLSKIKNFINKFK